ncbi:hypothetical protein FRB97_005753 [Tulasnella sp. 331]|nr:hypothetical protein FRB97_005753 [Tulasnella sp. 331]
MGGLVIDPTQILVYLHEFVAYAPTSQLIRYSQLAAFTAMFYDWSLNLGDEINYVWKRRWTFGTAVYGFTRYFAFCFQFFDIMSCLHKGLTQAYCTGYFWTLVSCSTFMLFIVQLTLQFRVHAMYHCDRRLLIFNSIFYVAVILGTAGFVIFAGPNVTAFPAPLPASGCWGIVPKYLFACWLPGLLFDGWLCFLVVRKARMHTRDQDFMNRKQNFLKLLVLDSVVWFGLMLILIVWNSINLASGINGINIVGLAFFHSGVNIGGSRLILNMREAYFTARTKKVNSQPGILGQAYPLRAGEPVPGVGQRTAAVPYSRNRATIYIQPHDDTVHTLDLEEGVYDGRSPPSTGNTRPGSFGASRQNSKPHPHQHHRKESSATYVNMDGKDEETMIGEVDADAEVGKDWEVMDEDEDVDAVGVAWLVEDEGVVPPVTRQPSRVQLQQFHRPIPTRQVYRGIPEKPLQHESQREMQPPQHPQLGLRLPPPERPPPRPRPDQRQHSSGRSIPELKPPPQYRRPSPPDQIGRPQYPPMQQAHSRSISPGEPDNPGRGVMFQDPPLQTQDRAPRRDRRYPSPRSDHRLEIALQTEVVVVVDGEAGSEGDGPSFARGVQTESPRPADLDAKKRKKKLAGQGPPATKPKKVERPSTAPTPGGTNRRAEDDGFRIGGRPRKIEPFTR